MRRTVNESQLRRIIRKLVLEETQGKPVPGDAPADKQVHAFDFDDTIGVTQDPNGIMLYVDGEPAWKTAEDAKKWCTEHGISGADIMKGPKGSPFEKPDGMDGFAAYISSGALGQIRGTTAHTLYSPKKPTAKDNPGDALVVDYSPSATAKKADPIPSVVARIKALNAKGAHTEIITARASETSAQGEKGPPKDFAGKVHPPSVEADLADFSKKQGINMDSIVGMGGGNKGKQIKNKWFDGKSPEEQPDEVHFYDDDKVNIDAVRDQLAGKVPAEVHLYGPGHFSKGGADPTKPSESFPPAEKTQKEGVDLDRWALLAGLRRRR